MARVIRPWQIFVVAAIGWISRYQDEVAPNTGLCALNKGHVTSCFGPVIECTVSWSDENSEPDPDNGRTLVMHTFRDAHLILAVVLLTASSNLAQGSEERVAVVATPHFAFHSDFATNLNDALLEAGRARNKEKSELFRTGTEASCFSELPPHVQAAWNHAVDYYAEIISSESWMQRQQYLIRLDLSGVEERDDPEEHRLVGIARNFRGAATPAYEACRWTTQDTENRRWIDQLVSQLRVHEKALSSKLADLYEMPLARLPIRVDVVQTVNWSGANTILLDPGGHIQVSIEEAYGPSSLELVFHEASHTLMGRRSPIRNALATAAEQLEMPLPDDLWHGVLFYNTGDAVRRILAEAGESAYTPMLFAGNIFGEYHAPMKRVWAAYLNGDRTLVEASMDLVRVVNEAAGNHP